MGIRNRAGALTPKCKIEDQSFLNCDIIVTQSVFRRGYLFLVGPLLYRREQLHLDLHSIHTVLLTEGSDSDRLILESRPLQDGVQRRRPDVLLALISMTVGSFQRKYSVISLTPRTVPSGLLNLIPKELSYGLGCPHW